MSEHIVTKKAMRPASSEQRCFYCKQKIGDKHLDTCVLVEKMVMVRLIVTFLHEVPNHWTSDNVESYWNKSSSCMSNALSDLSEYANRIGCLCSSDAKIEFVETVHSSENKLDEEG